MKSGSLDKLSMDRLSRNDILVLGRVGMDLYADPPGTRIEEASRFATAIGGSAGNIAVALARQGVQAGLLTRVSDDAVGRYCKAELARYGVDVTHVTAREGGARTSLAVTETRAEACQVVLYRNAAADFELTVADVERVDFSKVGALVVTGTALAAQPSRGATLHAIRSARAVGAVVVLDLDYRAYSWPSATVARDICLNAARASDVVIGNDQEFDLLGEGGDGVALARDLAHDRLFTIYKQGAGGSITFTPERSFSSPIFPVTALKPMGAGDGFMGGLLASLVRGDPLEVAVRRGSATAAIIVAGFGCAPASPDTPALDAFIESHAHAFPAV